MYEGRLSQQVINPKSIRILAVDDHPLFREGIASVLAAQPDMHLVAEASNGQDAIDLFRMHRPDITLMDLQMPEMSGLDAAMAILGEFPEARIIVLTTYTGDVQVTRAMKSGARGYLLKNLLHKNCWRRFEPSMLPRHYLSLPSTSPMMP